MHHSRAFVVMSLLIAGAGGAFAARQLSKPATDAVTDAIVGRVRGLSAAVAGRRYEVLWDALDPASRERLEASHRAFGDGVRRMRELLADPKSAADGERLLSAVEAEHGIARGDLERLTAAQQWMRRVARTLDVMARHEAYRDVVVERVQRDGRARAIVDVRLGDGRSQSFPLVCGPDAVWHLADFIPYCPGNGYLVARDHVGEVGAGASTSTTGPDSSSDHRPTGPLPDRPVR